MAWVLPVISGVFNVMETITFIMFIEEEAIQSAALGAFLAIRQKNYHAAWKAILLLDQVIIPHLEAVVINLGWASPATMGCFYDFVLASKGNVEIYKELCTAAGK